MRTLPWRMIVLLAACRPGPGTETPGATKAAPVEAPATSPSAPAIGDRDSDGVPDDVDRCPDEPQAMSAGCTRPTDGDGCPDGCRPRQPP